jgi:hypothetical protein
MEAATFNKLEFRWNALSSTRWMPRLCPPDIFAISATFLPIGPSQTGIFRKNRSTLAQKQRTRELHREFALYYF